MSIEFPVYTCTVCKKQSEFPVFNGKSINNEKLHQCSSKCFKVYQVATIGRQKEADEILFIIANKKITKEKPQA